MIWLISSLKRSVIWDLNSMSVQFRIVKIVPPSWNYIVRHLVALKQLQKMKLTALSWIWPRNRLLSIPYLHPCWSSALMSSLPVKTKMVSILLESGHFPSARREALVRPILNWEEWSWHCFQELLDRKQSFRHIKSNRESCVSSNWQPHEETWSLPITTICLQKEPWYRNSTFESY